MSSTDRKPKQGGVVTWACAPGFPPAVIFPFTPAERMGTRNILEFQALMYRTLYYFGTGGVPDVDYANSIGEEPVWSADGLTVTITVKPWQWSNGETLCADNVLFWVNLMKVKGARYGEYVPGYFPDNLTDYGKLAEDKVYFTFDKVYSQRWVLFNQLSTITPLPKAWDRTEQGPANASGDLADVEAVYAYLMAEQGDHVEEGNAHRTGGPTARSGPSSAGPGGCRVTPSKGSSPSSPTSTTRARTSPTWTSSGRSPRSPTRSSTRRCSAASSRSASCRSASPPSRPSAPTRAAPTRWPASPCTRRPPTACATSRSTSTTRRCRAS